MLSSPPDRSGLPRGRAFYAILYYQARLVDQVYREAVYGDRELGQQDVEPRALALITEARVKHLAFV